MVGGEATAVVGAGLVVVGAALDSRGRSEAEVVWLAANEPAGSVSRWETAIDVTTTNATIAATAHGHRSGFAVAGRSGRGNCWAGSCWGCCGWENWGCGNGGSTAGGWCSGGTGCGW